MQVLDRHGRYSKLVYILCDVRQNSLYLSRERQKSSRRKSMASYKSTAIRINGVQSLRGKANLWGEVMT